MHPTTAYEITKARIAEQRGEGGWGSTARAAARRHRIPASRRPQRARTLAGRALLLLTAPRACC